MGAQTNARRESLPPPGTVMGRYRLTRLIAAGGMAAVYEAEDEQRSDAVALKLLHPELTSERDVRRRFRRESSVLMAFVTWHDGFMLPDLRRGRVPMRTDD